MNLDIFSVESKQDIVDDVTKDVMQNLISYGFEAQIIAKALKKVLRRIEQEGGVMTKKEDY